MNKEKQIEQMAKDLKDIEELPTDFIGLATILYEEEGWRKQEWISIKDALPEKFDFYLVSIIDHFGLDCVTVLPYSNRCGFGSYEVTHWMPFPEPPKMKGGAE